MQVGMRPRQVSFDLRDGDHRKPADEEQEQREEQTERAEVRQDVDQVSDGTCPTRTAGSPGYVDVTMITKRSNHMPMLMRTLAISMIGTLVRARLNQKIWGTTTLQNTIA